MHGLTRREFQRLLFGAGAAGLLPGCGGDPSDYSEADAERLARQQREEAEQAGRSRFGPHVYRGYRGLAELPWFELSPEGRLRTAVELPGIIDIHTHLGMSVLFSPELDQTARTPRVHHLLDCDASEPGCSLDLDVYVNANFTEAMHKARSRDFLLGAFGWSEATRSHTAANLLAEMDDVGVERAAVLPIVLGLPFGDSLTEQWMRAIRKNGYGDRLLPFASVKPGDRGAIAQLRAHAAAGARGVKLHPEVQRFFPDAPEAMEIYAECERLGLPVVFHAGRSGIEPERLRPYALMRRYRPAVAEFPRVRFVFGHGGARDLADALPIAREHGNVWFGISSLGIRQIDRARQALGADRLIFGSDWPFYHLATTLAKILIVTKGDSAARDAMLRGSAQALLSG
jgi:predicted TIM-barrel fold metal-dependent hydrolase